MQTALRERIGRRGVAPVAAELGVSRNAIAQAAAGGIVHHGTRIAIEVGLGGREARTG